MHTKPNPLGVRYFYRDLLLKQAGLKMAMERQMYRFKRKYAKLFGKLFSRLENSMHNFTFCICKRICLKRVKRDFSFGNVQMKICSMPNKKSLITKLFKTVFLDLQQNKKNCKNVTFKKFASLYLPCQMQYFHFSMPTL